MPTRKRGSKSGKQVPCWTKGGKSKISSPMWHRDSVSQRLWSGTFWVRSLVLALFDLSSHLHLLRERTISSFLLFFSKVGQRSAAGSDGNKRYSKLWSIIRPPFIATNPPDNRQPHLINYNDSLCSPCCSLDGNKGCCKLMQWFTNLCRVCLDVWRRKHTVEENF